MLASNPSHRSFSFRPSLPAEVRRLMFPVPFSGVPLLLLFLLPPRSKKEAQPLLPFLFFLFLFRRHPRNRRYPTTTTTTTTNHSSNFRRSPSRQNRPSPNPSRRNRTRKSPNPNPNPNLRPSSSRIRGCSSSTWTSSYHQHRRYHHRPCRTFDLSRTTAALLSGVSVTRRIHSRCVRQTGTKSLVGAGTSAAPVTVSA